MGTLITLWFSRDGEHSEHSNHIVVQQRLGNTVSTLITLWFSSIPHSITVWLVLTHIHTYVHVKCYRLDGECAEIAEIYR